MLTSELIKRMQQILDNRGDLPVVIGKHEHQPADGVTHLTQGHKSYTWIWPELDPEECE